MLRRPWPLRVRLTAAFALAVGVVLAVTGLVVHLEFARGIDSAADAQLSDRAAQLRILARNEDTPGELLGASGEPFAQLYDRRGAVLASSHRVETTRLLGADEVRRVLDGGSIIRTLTHVPGTDDGARARAFPLPKGTPAAAAVVAESLDRAESERRRLAVLLVLALSSALALACYTGYQVAGAALKPVERMRARAASITDTDLDERLPAPGTRDELDRLASTLNELLGRLHDAVQRERQLVSDASHELRTPLAVLRTRVEVALRADRDPERMHATLLAVLDDARRLSRLADDLLVLARADQGLLPLRPEPLDVQDLLEHAAARHAREEHPISVEMSIPGGAVVLADADRVGQALDNLLANSVRYGRAPIELRAHTSAGDAIAITVRDHGPGYSGSYLPHAFERFRRADDRRDDTGSGLGLAIVAAIARAHGGRVTAANHPDGGALTTLELPVA